MKKDGITIKKPDGKRGKLVRRAITIKELHGKTGELVRQAGEALGPVAVTDHGKVVAVLGSPKLIKTGKRPKRGLPKSYLAFVKTLPRTDVMQYLDEERER